MSVFFTGDSSILRDSLQQPSRADQLMEEARRRLRDKYQSEDATRERFSNARGAVELRQREQLEQGYGGKLGDGTYYPEDTSAVADYIRKTVPASQLVGMRRPDAGSVNSVRVVPGIGHMTEIQAARGYTDAGKVMTGNRGRGSVVFGGPRKPATFDGKTKEQFFGQAAARQGADNKYARAEKTGKVDELGNPKFTSKAIPKGNTATSERIYEAMKQGGAKGKEKKKD